MLKAQHEFPECFLSRNHSYAPILLGSEMELCLNAWNLFLVLFLITTLFLLCSLGEKMQSIALTDVDDNFFAFTLDLFYREFKEFFSQVLN